MHRRCDSSDCEQKKDVPVWWGNLKLSMTHAVINGISDVIKFIKYKYIYRSHFLREIYAIFISRIYINRQIY